MTRRTGEERDVDVATRSFEAAEAEIERFIERRADRTPDPDDLEPSYAESVRGYQTRLEQAELWERARFHRRQLANHRATFREIIRRHKAGLAECERALGITNEVTKGDAA